MSTASTDTTSTDVDIQVQLQKLQQDNAVLRKQKLRATKDNESFRNQAVSQLESLQKSVAKKNTRIKTLRIEIKTATAASSASHTAPATATATTRELETTRSNLARANARIRQVEDDVKQLTKKHRLERQELHTAVHTTQQQAQQAHQAHLASEEHIALYRTQQEESVTVQHAYKQRTTALKQQVVGLTSDNSALDLERCRLREELTRERVAVETERRQRHELISKAEQDAIAKRQKLSRRVTKLTTEGLEAKASLKVCKEKNVQLQHELLTMLRTTEASEKKVQQMHTTLGKERQEQSRIVDRMLLEHQEHVVALRQTQEMKLKRAREDVAMKGSGVGLVGVSLLSSEEEKEDTPEDTPEEREEKERKVRREGASVIHNARAMRQEIKRLEGNVVGLEQSLEHLRKIHAARVSALIQRHKSTMDRMTAAASSVNQLNRESEQGGEQGGEGERLVVGAGGVGTAGAATGASPNARRTINTPAKRMLLAGSPMTMDKFEASALGSGGGGDDDDSRASTFAMGAIVGSGSSLPHSPSGYNRQLKLHHQTTLRELALSRSNCDRMASERTR